MKEQETSVTAVAVAYESLQRENGRRRSQNDGLDQLNKELMPKTYLCVPKKRREKARQDLIISTF